jgi:hypothetical protein
LVLKAMDGFEAALSDDIIDDAEILLHETKSKISGEENTRNPISKTKKPKGNHEQEEVPKKKKAFQK